MFNPRSLKEVKVLQRRREVSAFCFVVTRTAPLGTQGGAISFPDAIKTDSIETSFLRVEMS